MTDQHTWVEIYQELATELSKWENRQKELIEFLEQLRQKELVITSLSDKDEDGSRFLLSELDPFTFFGVFNRGIRHEQRIAILDEIRKFFNLKSPLATDFNGIPILNNMKSWFFAYSFDRKPDDIKKLWRVFQLALDANPLDNEEFLNAFDDALSVKNTNINLTMGLFWIRPNIFLNLDQTNRSYLDIKLPSSGLDSKFYMDVVNATKNENENEKYYKLSYKASRARFIKEEKKPIKAQEKEINRDANYWLVGAFWDDAVPMDQTDRFISEGIWINGYEDKYLDMVNKIKVGDKVAIKAASTQKKNLPFDSKNKTVSCMHIKARGTVVANRLDGRTLEIEWDSEFKDKIWYFFTNRATIWQLFTDEKHPNKEQTERLINFIWYNQEQDYSWFIDNSWEKSTIQEKSTNQPYSIEDVTASGVFMVEDEIMQVIDRLKEKKALILQGPPGVGKSFVAKKLAYLLMNEKDNERIEFIQFHQSYSYDDFVRGYRPDAGKAGSFSLKNGVFFEFCQKAKEDPDREYIFIIDEINRGNLSQIFGELLMLIEHDKRGKEYAVPLVYRLENEERFYIPSNVYLIGLMNLADRSLAMVDYALRRRFAFISLEPKYESPLFINWLAERSMNDDLINYIVEKLSDLNRSIREDTLLGENYQIGHSYFCPKGDDFSKLDKKWYQSIVKTEIIPLLKEYWFDNPQSVQNTKNKLLG